MNLLSKKRLERTWQVVAATLLLVFCATFATPFVTAQAAPVDACCRSMHGCGMHMHHAMQARSQHGDHWAAVQERCPCTPLAPASVSTHHASLAVSAHAVPAASSPSALARALTLCCRSHARSGADTRGPPKAPDLA